MGSSHLFVDFRAIVQENLQENSRDILSWVWYRNTFYFSQGKEINEATVTYIS